MYSLNQIHVSPSKDEGRIFNLFGANNNYAFIVYDRLACYRGGRRLIIFKLNQQNAKAIWSANIINGFNAVACLDSIRSYFQYAKLNAYPIGNKCTF